MNLLWFYFQAELGFAPIFQIIVCVESPSLLILLVMLRLQDLGGPLTIEEAGLYYGVICGNQWSLGLSF